MRLRMAANECGVTSPEAWMYVSKRLNVVYLPNVPLWSGECLTLGAVAYYRLTAEVLAWLELAGVALERQHLARQLPEGQLDEYLRVMNEVWVFAGRHIGGSEVRRARSEVAELPEAASKV